MLAVMVCAMANVKKGADLSAPFFLVASQ